MGTKFHADGSARPFPGSSIVCAIDPGAPQFELLHGIQQEAKRESFGESLAFLPPSSFHMTVFDLVCDQVRRPEHWSSRIALDTPLNEVDAELSRLLEPLSFPKDISMKASVVGRLDIGLHVLLEPAEQELAKELESFRDAVSRATGIRPPAHETYPFHVTLAYRLRYLSAEQERDLHRFTQRMDASLVETFGILELEPARLVFFEDMFAFPTQRGGRSSQ